MSRIETFRYLFHGQNGCISVCQIEIRLLNDGRTAVICSELADNPGSCVTSYAAELASSVCHERKIDPLRLVWIEHNPARGSGASRLSSTWERVAFTLTHDTAALTTFQSPVWRPMTFSDWSELGLPCPTPQETTESEGTRRS